jgi:hypothetical protein
MARLHQNVVTSHNPPTSVGDDTFIIDAFDGPPQASSSHHTPVASTSTLPVQANSIFLTTETASEELPVDGFGDLPGEQYQLNDNTGNESLLPEMQE